MGIPRSEKIKCVWQVCSDLAFSEVTSSLKHSKCIWSGLLHWQFQRFGAPTWFYSQIFGKYCSDKIIKIQSKSSNSFRRPEMENRSDWAVKLGASWSRWDSPFLSSQLLQCMILTCVLHLLFRMGHGFMKLLHKISQFQRICSLCFD